MTKKVKILTASILIFILLGIVVISGVSLYPIFKNARSILYDRVKTSVIFTDNYDKQYDFKLCRFNLKEPEYIYYYIYTSPNGTFGGYTFYQIKRNNIFSQNWNDIKYVGGGSVGIENFDQLKNLANKDCKQFKESKTINHEKSYGWSYTPASNPQWQSEIDKLELDKKIKEEEYAKKMEEEAKVILYGYTDQEFQSWVKNNLTEKQKDEVVIKGESDFHKMARVLIKEYGMPQKPGYPVD